MEPDNRIWANSDLWKLWCWCLDKANFYDKRWVSVKSGKGLVDVEIKKGQFVYGRHSAAEALGINPSTLRDRMTKLADLGFISISPDSQYSIITICNFEYYLVRDDLPTTTTPEIRRQSFQTSGDTTKQLKQLKQLKKNNFMADFEKFYKVYPKKKNRAEAEKAWQQLFHNSDSEYYIGSLTEERIEIILSAIRKQTAEKKWKTEAEEFCPEWPYPASWLRSKRWEDKVEMQQNTGKKEQDPYELVI